MSRRCAVQLSLRAPGPTPLSLGDLPHRHTTSTSTGAVMNMRGLAATVTSCIGGKDEKFAVQVRPAAPASVYFVYKTMGEFDALWGSLETLARDVKRRTCNSQEKPQEEKKPSLLAKWLAGIVDHYAFRQIIRDLRAQEKETMSTLNVLLQFLVARVSALYKERSLLHACTVGRQLVTLVRDFLQQPVAAITKTETVVKTTPSTKEGRKRSFEEMRPEDGEEQRSSLFPTRSGSERAVKTQKLCGMREWAIPPVGKLGMVAPVASRRRVFAEVEF
ncbi:hypothetical protein F441_19472 [Phytophthora nicotianae CJ01A1]|uniref:Uncharacterized protein n=2 Tax=Phytophthora nicotianae TaxID=4792 RepID=W2VZ15_PHYNI|nr:hypothetical protein L915_19068 [Phytophthora nicotianae]ETP03585.1 hypothetical protein F441_19472 [Phytophthora nicotianae CJ01A1]